MTTAAANDGERNCRVSLYLTEISSYYSPLGLVWREQERDVEPELGLQKVCSKDQATLSGKFSINFLKKHANFENHNIDFCEQIRD